MVTRRKPDFVASKQTLKRETLDWERHLNQHHVLHAHFALAAAAVEVGCRLLGYGYRLLVLQG